MPERQGRLAQRPGMPHPRSRVECPYIGATPRVQWRRALPTARIKGETRPIGLNLLKMRRGNARAIAPSHQHTVLSLAQIGDTHGEPNSNRRQRDRKSKGRNVRQHALAKIVRFAAVSFIARQVIRFLRLLPAVRFRGAAGWGAPPVRRLSQGARPEFEHPMLLIR
jgi:hypothetical protein